MDYYKPTKREARPPSPLLRLALSAGLGLGGGLLVFAPALLLLLPGLFAFVYAGFGRRYFPAAAAPFLAGCYFLFAPAQFAFMAGGVLAASLLLGELLLRKFPYRYTGALLSALLMASLYGTVCLPGVLSGAGPFAAAQGHIQQMGDRMTALAESAYQDGGRAAQLLRDSFDLLISSVPATLVGLLLACAMGAAGFALLLAAGLSRRVGAQLRPMAPFWEWRLNKSYLGGVAVLAAGAVALALLNLSYAPGVIHALEVVALSPLLVTGAATAEFIIRQQPQLASRRRPVVCLGALLLFPSSLLMGVLVGALDLAIGLRKRLPPSSTDVL